MRAFVLILVPTNLIFYSEDSNLDFILVLNIKTENLDRKSRIQSIRDEESDARRTAFKSPRPTPKFFPQETLSSKKDKGRRNTERPPPTPRPHTGSSSISRLLSLKDGSTERVQSISFRESKSSLSSKYDSNSDRLYFHQCFEVISQLGTGSFGEVFKVRCKEDGKYYAVKKAKNKFSGKADRARKLQEVQKYEELPSHPNCVRFYKAWEEKNRLYIQTELCSCSLSQYADQNHNIPEDTVWNCLVDLLSAVKHLHDHNLVHLDIKPENIFISENGVCKLGDFGLVLDLSKIDIRDATEGDPRYLAPELMQGFFTKAADIFSLGITILELASDLDLPNYGTAWHELRELKIPEQFIKGTSSKLLEVICLMMEPDYTKRPSVDDILQMETVQKVYHKRKQMHDTEKKSVFFTPLSNTSDSSEWGSNISDDVFFKDTSKNFAFSNDFCSEKKQSVCQESPFDCQNDLNFDSSRAARIGMSTPSCYRYWGQDSSGSPCLSDARKNALSAVNDSPKFAKSPRLQFHNNHSSEDDAFILPQRNLMSVFNSLSSPENSP